LTPGDNLAIDKASLFATGSAVRDGRRLLRDHYLTPRCRESRSCRTGRQDDFRLGTAHAVELRQAGRDPFGSGLSLPQSRERLQSNRARAREVSRHPGGFVQQRVPGEVRGEAGFILTP
jgi:hypothetical protein